MPKKKKQIARSIYVEEIRTRIAGVTYNDPRSGLNRQDIIRRYVYPGIRLIPQREPGNPHDGHAVKLILEVKRLFGKKRFHLGYIPRDFSENIDKALRKKIPVEVIVTRVTGGTPDKPHRGVSILIRYAL